MRQRERERLRGGKEGGREFGRERGRDRGLASDTQIGCQRQRQTAESKTARWQIWKP